MTKIKDHLHPLIYGRLLDLGYKKDSDIISFLYPKLEQLQCPTLMKNMKEITECIVNHLISGKKILICGDYDVDGITSTYIITKFLTDLGFPCSYFLPNRLTDGYGLNIKFIKMFAENNIANEFLILTVDCGVSNKDEIAKAKDLGFEVIVTDHHQPNINDLPDCLILNCKQDHCGFGSEELAGVGTAFFLLISMRSKLDKIGYFATTGISKPNLKSFLAFVAIGTIADVVPLSFTNRLLAKAGFEVLDNQENLPIGLQRLVVEAGIGASNLQSEDIGFGIAPLINAAGRMGSPEIALKLFLTENVQEAERLIKELVSLNKKRKIRTSQDLELTLAKCNNSMIYDNKCLIEFGSIHQGVMGIIAAKLVETFSVPAIVFSEVTDDIGETLLKGSGRSIAGIDLLDLIKKCEKYTLKYGGHSMAAGLTIRKRDFENFKALFISSVNLVSIKTKRPDYISAAVDEILDLKFISQLQLLEPFGPGNEKPVYLDSEAQIVYSKNVGTDKTHVQLVIRGKYKNHKGIGYNLSKSMNGINQEDKATIVYSPSKNHFNNRVSWQIQVHKILQ